MRNGVSSTTYLWLGLERRVIKLRTWRAWRPSLTPKLKSRTQKKPFLDLWTGRPQINWQCIAPPNVVTTCKANQQHSREEPKLQKGPLQPRLTTSSDTLVTGRRPRLLCKNVWSPAFGITFRLYSNKLVKHRAVSFKHRGWYLVVEDGVDALPPDYMCSN